MTEQHIRLMLREQHPDLPWRTCRQCKLWFVLCGNEPKPFSCPRCKEAEAKLLDEIGKLVT